MKHNKNEDTLLFLLSFNKCQRKKIAERLKKAEKQQVQGLLYHNIHRIQKINFQ